jgi:hypothetical protein
MSDQNNLSAFPSTEHNDDGSHFTDHPGMTLRDWFAGQALPAIIVVTSAGQHSPSGLGEGATVQEALALDAYALADAMLAEREKATK